MTRFFIRLLIFSAIIFFILLGMQGILPDTFVYPPFWYIQLFMILVTAGFHIGLLRAGEKSNNHFIRFFMGATAGKLFLFMIVMIGYALFNKSTAVPFIVHFFLLYLFYTIFEVALVYRKFSGMKAIGSK